MHAPAVVNVASVTADLVAQKSSVTGSDVKNVFGARAPSCSRTRPPDATIEIYSIVDDGSQGAGGKIAWSCKMVNGDPATATATSTSGVPVDADGKPTTGGVDDQGRQSRRRRTEQWGGSGSVIIGKITYAYSSPVTKMVTGEQTMVSLFYAARAGFRQIAAPASCS